MIDVWEKFGTPNISAVRVPEAQVGKYGIADVSPIEGNVYKINSIVEKPKPQNAPGNLAAHGAYIMPPQLFEMVGRFPVRFGPGGGSRQRRSWPELTHGHAERRRQLLQHINPLDGLHPPLDLGHPARSPVEGCRKPPLCQATFLP